MDFIDNILECQEIFDIFIVLGLFIILFFDENGDELIKVCVIGFMKVDVFVGYVNEWFNNGFNINDG